MDIIFADKKLKKYANDNRLAKQKLGPKRATLFQRRLQDMADVNSFNDLQYLPGNYHQLKNDRAEQWACDLDQPYRLVFMPGITPIPKDKHGKQVLTEIEIVDILEITNYHKEK